MKFWFFSKKDNEEVEQELTDAPDQEVASVVEPAPPPVAPPPPPASATSGGAKTPNAKTLFFELINGLYDAIFVLDENGHIVDCNNRVEQVLGYARDDMWDVPIGDVVRGIDPIIFRKMRDGLKGARHVMINAKCVRKDKTEFMGEIGVSIIHLTRNENLVFAVRNVERRIRAVRDQVASELRDKFPEAANVVMPAAKTGVILKKVVAKPKPAAAAAS